VPRENVKTDFKFFYIINFYDKPPVATENAFIDPQSTLAWYHLPDSVKEVRSLLNVDIIYVIKLKPNTKLLTLNQFFDEYRIQQKFRKLHVMVDDDIIDYPETMFISQNQIDKVKIIRGAKGSYIRIILKGYYESKKRHPNDKMVGG
jgi:hypothetical protein